MDDDDQDNEPDSATQGDDEVPVVLVKGVLMVPHAAYVEVRERLKKKDELVDRMAHDERERQLSLMTNRRGRVNLMKRRNKGELSIEDEDNWGRVACVVARAFRSNPWPPPGWQKVSRGKKTTCGRMMAPVKLYRGWTYELYWKVSGTAFTAIAWGMERSRAETTHRKSYYGKEVARDTD